MLLKMAPIPLFIFFFLTHSLPPSSAEDKEQPYKCPPFSCGKFGLIQFPFNSMKSPGCGVFSLDCSENKTKIQLKEGGHWYGVKSFSQADSIVVSETISLSHSDIIDECKTIDIFSLPSPKSTLFQFYNLTVKNSSTFYNCSHSDSRVVTPPKDFHQTKCGEHDFYSNPRNISFPFEQQCQVVTIPFPLQHHEHPTTQTRKVSVDFNFQVQPSHACWTCHLNRGKCHNTNENQFQCLDDLVTLRKGHDEKKKPKLGLGLAVALGGIGTLVVMLIYYFRKKHNHAHQSIETFLKNCGPLHIRRYNYSNIKKMTNSFKEKLGQGGFGSVYKGKLHDGHLVAVKMLNELKANDGGDFINEVAAISRTSHVNVVRLLGFCFEDAKKALIYEFMPNGSLEKFVYDENETEESYQLDWETYYQISLGTARGLEYLHRGCNTRILHFDIKPHNILLDADFVPKISDFGLAKICTRKDSVVSMLGPRGTIGYIAPEVFSRNFGGVSHKSDVYSYGMMVLEMVGGRKNVNIRDYNSSELYFPQWIYERLELKELGLKRIISEEDNAKSRKMIMTSLWCIQTDPSSRPTMSRVIEMLEGSLDSLKVPPKPFLSSPPRSSPSDSSNILISL
ncbi:LEAF RUST 10 DISEASE-RESISTANCE LOCUS RECEPTOR-LIKE PROTEIN KINASE-like 2.3 [Humulus lupulus]|uniref:LEAF RUST 10 DISEASE-RESISTANCE LOCUS RECEPTOR-LIKE PROTEIN KINASE-like 2.3 n=1 Tax=Humulus lupulus TaxID=3486 RepID=UPI002B4178E9|nr:LEAF RUST 10 DISEASE-RESISTANCE LOCUS RECEPTOR-LIKE PROTEIN KINASE-like 2.3 [Humulus lupulus]